MKEQLMITIPEPCHEDWNKMTPVEQGRHCAVCKKNVVDFTTAHDEAIVDFFKNYNGSACGRFNHEQLNRPIEVIELKPASNFLKYAAGLLLPGLMLSKVNGQKRDTVELKEIVVMGYGKKTVGKVVSCTPVAGPVKIKAKDTFQIKPLKPVSIDYLLSGKLSCLSYVEEKHIRGKVIDEHDGAPLANVTIQIAGTKIGTTSGADGSFSLSLTEPAAKLIFSYVGYEKVEVSVKRFDTTEMKIKMKTYEKGMVEVVAGYVIPKKNKKTHENKTIQKLKDTVAVIFNKIEIKAYPNPVIKGGAVNLNFGKSKPGNYQIQLLNEAGQLFYSFQKQVSSVNETEQIHLNEKMGAGVYLLQIIDDKKRLVQTSTIIVQ
jgi:CarboxypepD_reg-like domain/Secretion system C-terminal sorting domain